MANKLKKPAPPKPAEKPVKKENPRPVTEKLKQDREEQVDLKKLAKDERTWKIMGTVSLLVAIFLFLAFISYFFTWKEDQDKLMSEDSFLLNDELHVANLLGRLGAWTAHGFIYNGFGAASLLFCTFFFVLGINLLTNRKVYSLWRNLRYVTFGLVIASVCFSFLFGGSDFPFGGRVGDMISNWMSAFMGSVGTAVILLVVAISYLIWQFNPTFKMPERKAKPVVVEEEEEEEEEEEQDLHFSEMDSRAAAPLAQKSGTAPKAVLAETRPMVMPEMQTPEPKANALKGDIPLTLNVPQQEQAASAFALVEKETEYAAPTTSVIQPAMGAELLEDFSGHAAMDTAEMSKPAAPVVIMPKRAFKPEAELVINNPVAPESPAIEVTEPEEDFEPEVSQKPEPFFEIKQPEPLPEVTFEIKQAEPEVPESDFDGAGRQKDYSDLPPYEPTLDLRDYKFPVLELLEAHGSEKIVQDAAELEANKNQILSTLKNYSIEIQKISATVGPTVTLYEIVPAAGVRISRIKNLEDDIALSLAALGIRIIAPIPGKGTIGIEVPNVKKTVVSMRTLLASDKFQHSNFSLPIAIGKKIDNENFIADLATMPHLLMAGATGQGKSVGLNAILVSLLYKKHPSQLKFVLVDPKKVELSVYRHIEKHFLAKLPGEEEAIITDTKKVINTLNALCIEMDNRYDLLKEAGTRNIKEYNEKFTKRRLNPQKGHQYLPFIVLVVDEFADLIMTAGKEVEMPIARLAQLARAVGIHLIIATQRPSVNIITGTIKANFPARIAFKVSSKIDSRTILDAGGAEQLIGKGDMLISYNGEIVRLQCAFVDTPEVERVVDHIGVQRGYSQAFLLPEYVDDKEVEKGGDLDSGERDPLFADAARLIVQNQVGSTSLIQRRMKLGYNRAGRLMDQLERAGVVGPNLGSKAREVLFKTEHELEEFLENFG
ncbi:DNA segregation ATPase FtsK/SpoIIIE, S-DNA-T family [Cnuella takakiae]|uniref:DNA segregation ATPase FtsK/SpoIIIE, S-DNA-T family n=1 Tax=Cnuella takakiae TaxID=1302690 RepID=A0A1M5HH03_9BACT|nr:DNA translocase FtsK [Cnuella takakiae]OLY92868.1 cell division protein FtsK [Cnuella takakiae]SHG15236.1 DNA segregation ATPase FtsK/SpoIIIE, S-DNA-T family [Cnuella takakiae]